MATSLFQHKWIFAVSFAALALLAGVLTAILLGGGPTELGYAIGGGLVIALVVVTTYVLGRRAGHPHSHAVAEAAVAFGSLYLLAVTFRLLTVFGQRTTVEVGAGLFVAIVGSAAFVAVVAWLGRYNAVPN